MLGNPSPCVACKRQRRQRAFEVQAPERALALAAPTAASAATVSELPPPALEPVAGPSSWVPPPGRPGLYDAEGRLVLKSLTLPELEAWCAAEGEPSPANRALQLWRWMYADPPAGSWVRRLEDTLGRQNGLSAKFIERVGHRVTLDGGLTLQRVVRASDGTRKLVFGLTCGPAAGGSIEAVLIPVVRRAGLRDRLTICVSSQVGCAMNCQFCYTGRMGLLGNLTTAQIVEQVVEARRFLAEEGDRTPLTNLVFMGMGEPLHNAEAVLAAAEIMGHYLGLHISHNKMTISTVGLVPEMRSVLARSRVQMALSLHATTDEVRDWIVPVNRRYDLATLTAALEELFPKAEPAPPRAGLLKEQQQRQGEDGEEGDAEEERQAGAAPAALAAPTEGAAGGAQRPGCAGSADAQRDTAAPDAAAAPAAAPDAAAAPSPSCCSCETPSVGLQGHGTECGSDPSPSGDRWLPPLGAEAIMAGPGEGTGGGGEGGASSASERSRALCSTSASSDIRGDGGDEDAVETGTGVGGGSASGSGRGERSLLVEYTMLHGINDTLQDAERLAEMLSRVNCKVNLIVFNPHAGTRFRPSTDEDISAFRSALIQRGLVCTIRDSRGDDEMAACGQLGNVGLAFRPSPLLEPPERFRSFLRPAPEPQKQQQQQH